MFHCHFPSLTTLVPCSLTTGHSTSTKAAGSGPARPHDFQTGGNEASPHLPSPVDAAALATVLIWVGGSPVLCLPSPSPLPALSGLSWPPFFFCFSRTPSRPLSCSKAFNGHHLSWAQRPSFTGVVDRWTSLPSPLLSCSWVGSLGLAVGAQVVPACLFCP